MKITTEKARELAEKFSLNLDVIPLQEWKRGIEVELEHGIQSAPMEKMIGKTNVTNDDLVVTAMIALAHIIEFPDYYYRLDQMEKQAEKYWKNKKKPNIFVGPLEFHST